VNSAVTAMDAMTHQNAALVEQAAAAAEALNKQASGLMKLIGRYQLSQGDHALSAVQGRRIPVATASA
jgi:methyl-accepting chemotaxis protein